MNANAVDSKGHQLEVGDEVTMRFKITHLSRHDDHTNCTLESLIPIPPANATKVICQVNTKQLEWVVKAQPAPASTQVNLNDRPGQPHQQTVEEAAAAATANTIDGKQPTNEEAAARNVDAKKTTAGEDPRTVNRSKAHAGSR